MISGAHAILYSTDADADRAFLRDVLGLRHVDSGGGWLIFGLPPSEVAIHPAEKSGAQELYFLVDDVKAFVASMKQRKIACGPVQYWTRKRRAYGAPQSSRSASTAFAWPRSNSTHCG